MKIVSKRFRFGKVWEILLIDGQVFFLVKDILRYFDFSPKSQGTVKGAVNDFDRTIISGKDVRDLKHVTGRAMIVNRAGLMDFVQTLSESKKEKGQAFMKFVNETATPDLKKLWEKTFKSKIVVELPFSEDLGQDDPDLFEMAKEMEITELKVQVDSLQKRVESLEKQVKELHASRMVDNVDGRTVIDADAFIDFLKGSGPRGNVR